MIVGVTGEYQEWDDRVPQTPDDRPFQCPQCPKSYRNASTLKRHLKFECGVQPAFPCAYCTYKAKRKEELNNHTLRKHQFE